MPEPIQNAKLYRELCDPFESTEKFMADASDFAAEVRALRAKYQIPDVVMIVSANVQDGSDEGVQTILVGMGDARNLLWALREAYQSELGKMRKV